MQGPNAAPDWQRIAAWMAWLLASRRFRGITCASVAQAREARGCNVSAFMSSNGHTKNVKADKLLCILLDLGLLPNGALTPGTHCWNVPTDPQFRDVLGDVLAMNPTLDSSRPARCLQWRGGDGAFLVHRPTRLAVVLARISDSHVRRLRKRKDIDVAFENITAAEATELETIWRGGDAPEWVIERAIDSYLDPHQAPQAAIA